MSRIENKRVESIGNEIDNLDYEEILSINATQEEIEEIRDKLDEIL